jgi:hypothetical protein
MSPTFFVYFNKEMNLRHMAYTVDPWEHVLFIGLGAYAGNKFEEKYENDMKEVEELRLYLERRPAIRKEE